MSSDPSTWADGTSPFAPEAFAPSLLGAVQDAGLAADRLSVTLRLTEDDRVDMTDRANVMLSDGHAAAIWCAPPLRDLFRGSKLAPSDIHMYPRAYVPMFYFIEKHAITFCDAFQDRTDEEFERIYSELRRRPDGKTPDALHHFLWQVCAALLGMTPLSQAEFSAILQQLARSARRFHLGLASRNYIAYLRSGIART